MYDSDELSCRYPESGHVFTYLWDFDLGTLLEVLSEGIDEILGWDVLDSDGVLLVNNSELNLFS